MDWPAGSPGSGSLEDSLEDSTSAGVCGVLVCVDATASTAGSVGEVSAVGACSVGLGAADSFRSVGWMVCSASGWLSDRLSGWIRSVTGCSFMVDGEGAA